MALAPLLDRYSIARALARAIGLPESDQTTFVNDTAGEDPLDRVVAALATSKTTLLIDNCEHVIEPAAEIVHRVLVECPSVDVIATSRASLASLASTCIRCHRCPTTTRSSSSSHVLMTTLPALRSSGR